MEKFLTVFAIFDDDTQTKLKYYQDKVMGLGYEGTQTMDIPFHISLGTYSVGEEEQIKETIKKACSSRKSFKIELSKVNRFGYKVLFIEPKSNNELLELHKLFDNNIFDDGLPWHPHATIFMGNEEQVKNAEEYLIKIFEPINARIVGIQMGEFFPTRMIAREKLE